MKESQFMMIIAFLAGIIASNGTDIERTFFWFFALVAAMASQVCLYYEWKQLKRMKDNQE